MVKSLLLACIFKKRNNFSVENTTTAKIRELYSSIYRVRQELWLEKGLELEVSGAGSKTMIKFEIYLNHLAYT